MLRAEAAVSPACERDSDDEQHRSPQPANDRHHPQGLPPHDEPHEREREHDRQQYPRETGARRKSIPDVTGAAQATRPPQTPPFGRPHADAQHIAAANPHRWQCRERKSRSQHSRSIRRPARPTAPDGSPDLKLLTARLSAVTITSDTNAPNPVIPRNSAPPGSSSSASRASARYSARASGHRRSGLFSRQRMMAATTSCGASGAKCAKRDRLLRHDPGHEIGDGIPLVRRPAGEHGVADGPERVEIASAVNVALARGLLRRHVLGRPDRRPGVA